MKHTILLLILTAFIARPSQAQLKEVAQLATLSPTILVIYSDIENYKKNHFTVSTIGYLGSYMVLESKWKAALLTLLLGATKEIVYDGLLGRGEPLWDDMKWNALGVSQGLVFSVSLNF
jgi:hypothetical protein